MLNQLCLVFNFLCCFLVLLSVKNVFADEKDEKQTEKDKIKRKQPDDPFLPAMIVFNLDHTLWPFTMEMMEPPFVTTGIKHQIRDKVGKVFDLFPDVRDMLEELDRKWYKLGGLSEIDNMRRIEQTTKLFDIDQFFNAYETKPGNKTEQMHRLSEKAKVPLENILYYDTNQSDLDGMRTMNVTSVYLDPKSGGITYTHLQQGFRIFREGKMNSTAAAPTTNKP